MSFTDWLKEKLPHLENESSAITFKYIEQAKASTYKLRLLITFINVVLVVIVGYWAGYFLGKYSIIDSSIAIAISIAVLVCIASYFEDKIKNKVIRKELLTIACTELKK